MFINENFWFNNIYSLDMNVSICTVNNNDMFNNIGVEYVSNINVENDMIDYHPYYSETFAEPSEIVLNLLIYDYMSMKALDTNEVDVEAIYDWLITDDFAPFISDDNPDVIYYFKVTKISKTLTFGGKGYLTVTFKPFSKYCYKREVYKLNVNGENTLKIFNHSRQLYKPIIEITNLGDETTVNTINNMEIFGLKENEKIIIDNLSKIIQDENKSNKFNCCNRMWVELTPREYSTLILNGNFDIKVICEFPIII